MVLLNSILIIDDNDTENQTNKSILKELKCVKDIYLFRNGLDALHHLNTPVEGRFPIPDFIFLDVYMPNMNGWEFLEAYNKQIPPSRRGKALFVMMPNNRNSEDLTKAIKNPTVSDILTKPLTTDQIRQIISKYYPEFQPLLGANS